jgi:hypothetical protein
LRRNNVTGRNPQKINPEDAGLPNLSEQTDAFDEIRNRLANIEETVHSQVATAPVPAVDEDVLPESTRVFVAPMFPQSRFLVRAGKVVQVPSPYGPWDKERIGDIWVEFNDGILKTDNPEVIAWCEAHDGSPIGQDRKGNTVYEPDICKDAYDPQADAWAAIKEAQLETSTKAPRLPKNLSAQKLLAGEIQELADPDNIMMRARRVR